MALAGRYPLDPLAQRAGIVLHQPGRNGAQTSTNQSYHPNGLAALAQRIGVSFDHIRHVARNGLTDRQADRWAVACGFLPSQVWDGDWWDHAPDEGDDWYAEDPPLDQCTPRLQSTMAP